MGESCSLKCNIRNKQGEVVESKLFNDLLHYTSNDRKISKDWYSIGTDKKFLDKVGSKASYDENGEITFSSLRRLAKLSLKDEKELEILNKDIHAGVYPFDEAYQKLQDFNENTPYKDKYIATIEEIPGSYNVKLKVVYNISSNTDKLENEVEDNILKENIINHLKNVGISVDFLTGKENFLGRFRTSNTKKTTEGLLAAISVANNEHTTETLAELAGHVMANALKDSPLIERLRGLLTPEVQQSLMGDEYADIAFLEDPAMEVIGHLIGKEIYKGDESHTPIHRLIEKFVNYAKGVFSKVQKRDIIVSQIKAQGIARTIARGFSEDKYTGSAENLDTDISIYTGNGIYSRSSVNVHVFNNILSILKKQTDEMRSVSKSLYKKYNGIEQIVAVGRPMNVSSMFSDALAFDGITQAVTTLIDTLPEMVSKLNTISSEIQKVGLDDIEYRIKSAQTLREVSVFIQNTIAIIKILDTCTLEDSPTKLKGFDLENLRELRRTLNDSIQGDNMLAKNLRALNRQFYGKFLESILGRNYVHRAARVIFDKFKVKAVDGGNIPLQDLLDEMEEDISFYESHLASMINNSDIIGQLNDKAIKMYTKIVDDKTIETQDRLKVLYSEMSKYGVKDTREFFEVGKDGKLTGNIIGRLNWGDYENNWNTFRQEAKRQFFQQHRTDLNGKSNTEKSLMFDEYFAPLARQWYKENSKWNPVDNMFIPNDSYINEVYRDTIEGTPKDIFLTKYLEIKRDIDSYLDDNCIPHRAPQFKGLFLDKVKNRHMTQNLISANASTFRSTLGELFCENSDDRDFGGAQTYNTLEDDIFSNKLDFDREKIKRVPLYGINKLQNMDDISTDLIQSTLAYAGMAYNYSVFNSMANTFELGLDVLRGRKIPEKGGGMLDENTRKQTSRAYIRLQKYLDKQVYGVGVKKIKIGKKLIVNKIVGFCTGIASKLFLGGNVLGGIVNVITGFNEIFKESASGEFYNMTDWKNANDIYFKNLPLNWLQAGSLYKNDKLSLFIRKMNILNNSKDIERDFHTRKGWLRRINLFGENLYLPYKVGEHYMQTMSFLALASHIKLLDENDNKISLYNAFKVVNIDNNNLKAGKTLKLKEGIRYIDENNVIKPWNTEREIDFMNKAKIINNRLHGIYNSIDKTTFQQNLYGNMLLAMRGYALGMFERRFSGNKYSVLGENEFEGTITTMTKMIMSTFTDKGGFSLTMRALFLPLSKETERQMLKAKFSPNQYRNIRRSFADSAVITSLFILKSLLALGLKGGDDDDDDDKKDSEGYRQEKNRFLGMLYYFTSRAFTEQSAYNTPWGMVREAPVVTNVSPVGFSVLSTLEEVVETFASGEKYKKSGATYKEGDLKWVHKAERLMPYYRSYVQMQTPYQASQSYQYGRANRVK